jgi:hypothetical protein
MTHSKPTAEEKKAYAIVGRFGGRAIVKKYGKKYMSKLSKMGTATRWPDRKKSK